MHRIAVVLCLLGALASIADGQSSRIEPIHVAAGTVLDFHLQTRLKPVNGDVIDGLAEGTILRVKILNAIDTDVDRDGTTFHGSITSPVSLGDQVIVHSDAEVRGILALLRSKNHPEGFRYELLVTGITESGKPYALTASLSPSLFDASEPSTSAANSGAKPIPSASKSAGGKLP